MGILSGPVSEARKMPVLVEINPPSFVVARYEKVPKLSFSGVETQRPCRSAVQTLLGAATVTVFGLTRDTPMCRGGAGERKAAVRNVASSSGNAL